MEYMLQKRTLSHWSYVTWYEDLEQAKKNFLAVSKEGNGYSWRLVEVIVIDEKLLDGVRKAEIGDDVSPNTKLILNEIGKDINAAWLDPKLTGEFKSDWGNPMAGGWGEPAVIDGIKDTGHSHGSAGTVWMVHFGLKKKTRVPMSQMDSLMAQGYVKGSPRTVL